jgi:hypothetical protein
MDGKPITTLSSAGTTLMPVAGDAAKSDEFQDNTVYTPAVIRVALGSFPA